MPGGDVVGARLEVDVELFCELLTPFFQADSQNFLFFKGTVSRVTKSLQTTHGSLCFE